MHGGGDDNYNSVRHEDDTSMGDFIDTVRNRGATEIYNKQFNKTMCSA